MKICTSFMIGGALAFGIACPAIASDTVTYGYDALGRLVTTNVSGGPNSGVAAGTSFDPAGNRTGYTVNGAASFRAARSPASTAQKTPPPPSVPVFKLDDK